MPDFDVVIAGAGPAGSVAAIVLARSGHSVMLCDREIFPRNKPCGEGILPGGVRVLRGLGLLNRLLSEAGMSCTGQARLGSSGGSMGASRIEQIGFHIDARHSYMFHVKTDSSAFGIAMSRPRLDMILLEQAQRDGATVLQGARFESCAEKPEHVICRFDRDGVLVEHTCRFFLNATGAAVNKSADGLPPASRPDLARFGISTHIPDLAPASRVDVFIRDGYEIYTSSLDRNFRIVSVLCEPRIKPLFAQGLREAYRTMILVPVRKSILPEWLSGDPEKIIGAGLESPREPQWGTNRRMNIGDALVRTDPVAAQGLTLALYSGATAARIIADALVDKTSLSKILAQYRNEMTGPIHRSQRIATALLFLARRPWLAKIAFRLSRDSNIAALADPLSSVTLFGVIASCFNVRVSGSIMKKRATEPEIMDTMNAELLPRSTYRFLSFFNRYLGGERATVYEILGCLKRDSSITPWGRRMIRFTTYRLADIGGGDGDMAKRLALKLERVGVRVKPICIDPHLPRHKSEGVSYIVGDIRRLPLRDSAVDFTVSSLLFHHLADSDTQEALRECSRSAKVSVIINDLVRSFHGWLVTSLITALFGDKIVRHDGPLSVRKAFTRDEVFRWLRSPHDWSYRQYPFFRFVLTRNGAELR